MSKLMIVMLAVLTVASASVIRLPTGRPALQQKLEKIISLIPISKVRAVVDGYIESGDGEVSELAAYVRSGRLLHLVQSISALPAVQEQIRELETKGIRVNETILYARDLILRQNAEPTEKVKPASKGLAGLYDQILSVIPIEKVFGELVMLFLTDSEVQVIYTQLSKRECYEAAREVLGWEEVRTDLRRLQRAGVDVRGAARAAEGLLGWPRLMDEVDY